MEKKCESQFIPHNCLLRSTLDGSPVAMFILDCERKVVYWNRACAQLTGVPSDQVIGTNQAWKAFYKEDRPVLAELILENNSEMMEKLYAGKVKKSVLVQGAYEAEGYFPDINRWLFFTAAPLYDESGVLMGSMETLQDITEQKITEKKRQSVSQLLSMIVDETPVPMLVLDEKHHVTHWNNALERMTGIQSQEILGTQNHGQPFSIETGLMMADQVIENALKGRLETPVGNYHVSPYACRSVSAEVHHEVLGINRDVWINHTATPLVSRDGDIMGSVETFQDLSFRREMEEEILLFKKKLKEIDIVDVSGLFTQKHMVNQITSETGRARRYGRQLSLLFMEIDGYENFCAHHGLARTAKVVSEFNEMLHHVLRNMDSAYRYGDNRFVIMLPETLEQDADKLAERIRTMFEHEKHQTEEGFVSLTLSVGVAALQTGEDEQALLNRAKSNMSSASVLGGNQIFSVR